MKNLLFLGIAIVLLGTQGVAGFSVSAVSVNPPGDVKDRTPVTVTFEIPRAGILVYDQLVITTDLDSPAWDPVIIVRNNEMTVPPASANGNTLIINGAVYNEPSPVPVKLRVSVRGTVPANHTANQTLLGIRQIDSEGTPYAYPSGNFTLPMPGSLSTNVSETSTPPTTPAEDPVSEVTAPAMLTPVPEVSPATATVSSPRTTVSLPTPLPGRTPAAAMPAEPLVVFGAAGIAVYLVRKPAGR